MSTNWYVKGPTKQLGPLKAAQLKRLAQDGEVRPETPVRRGESGHWVPARTVKGLFAEASEAPKWLDPDDEVLSWIGPPLASAKEPATRAPEETVAGEGADAQDVYGVAAEPPPFPPARQAAPVPPESAALACPRCRRNLPPEAVLCVSCGYNLATGRTLQRAVVSRASPTARHPESDRDQPRATSHTRRRHRSFFGQAWSDFGRPDPWIDRLLPACGFMWLVSLVMLIPLVQLPVDVPPALRLGIVAGAIAGPPLVCLFAVVAETVILALLLRITWTRVPPGASIADIVSEVIYWCALAGAASTILAIVGGTLPWFLLLSLVAGFLGWLVAPATVYRERLELNLGKAVWLAVLRQMLYTLVWMPFLARVFVMA